MQFPTYSPPFESKWISKDLIPSTTKSISWTFLVGLGLYLILILLRGESSGVIFLIKFIKFIVSSIFKLFLVKPFENVICVSGDPVTFATFDWDSTSSTNTESNFFCSIVPIDSVSFSVENFNSIFEIYLECKISSNLLSVFIGVNWSVKLSFRNSDRYFDIILIDVEWILRCNNIRFFLGMISAMDYFYVF